MSLFHVILVGLSIFGPTPLFCLLFVDLYLAYFLDLFFYFSVLLRCTDYRPTLEMAGENDTPKTRDKNATVDSPCRACWEEIPTQEDGLQCDRCAGWVHAHEKCSQLNKQQFKFMKKWVLPAIQYICLKCRECESESACYRDAVAKNAAKLESFGESLALVKDQNKEIIDILKKNAKTDDSIKMHVTEAIDIQREREERKFNLILYNVPESDSKTGEAQAELEDLQNAKNVFNYVSPSFDHSGLKSVVRCGRKREANAQYPNPRPRPIKVTLKDPSHVLIIRKNARKLKDNDGLKHVGISEDKTFKEREEDRKLRATLIKRRNDGEDVVIYNKNVILRSEIAKLRENSVGATDNSEATGPAPGAGAAAEGGAGQQN